jgi:signal recognition particle subunit SRP14
LQLTAKDHLRFQTSYGTVLKAHMDSLKKKEKKDKKEKKTIAAKALVS